MRIVPLLGLLLAGCPSQYPGELLGNYTVTSRMTDSSCGPGVGDASQHQFAVEVRRDEEVAYWIGPDGLARTGSIDDEGTFRFHIEGRVLVREGDEITGILPCALDQVDEFSGSVDDELDAQEDLYVAAATDTDCTDQIGITTGKFLTLPCTLHFSLEGQPE